MAKLLIIHFFRLPSFMLPTILLGVKFSNTTVHAFSSIYETKFHPHKNNRKNCCSSNSIFTFETAEENKRKTHYFELKRACIPHIYSALLPT
jgi:hypothetical protein